MIEASESDTELKHGRIRSIMFVLIFILSFNICLILEKLFRLVENGLV